MWWNKQKCTEIIWISLQVTNECMRCRGYLATKWKEIDYLWQTGKAGEAVILICCKVLSWHSVGGTEGSREKSEGLVSWVCCEIPAEYKSNELLLGLTCFVPRKRWIYLLFLFNDSVHLPEGAEKIMKTSRMGSLWVEIWTYDLTVKQEY
jgi:hypothetical protein